MENEIPGAAGRVNLGNRYHAHAPALRRYLGRLTRSEVEAEDLAQQVWLRLLESERDGASLPVPDGEFRAYLYTSGRNLYVDEHVRKHGRSRTSCHAPDSLERHVQACDGETAARHRPDVQLEHAQVCRLVWSAIAALPRCQQSVVTLWMAGQSIKSMAERTGAAPDTVLSRKKYAIRRLRPVLGPPLGWRLPVTVECA